MKSIYIPAGESKSYEYLVADNLVVEGHLNVENGLKAKYISGHGVITAGSVSGDVIVADEIETAAIVCKCLMAKRVVAAEVFASESAAVSCYLSAGYVETGKLTTAISEISEVKADEVIHLQSKKRSMMLTLFLSSLRSFWLAITAPMEEAEDAAYEAAESVTEDNSRDRTEPVEDDPLREKIGQIVRDYLEENAVQEKPDPVADADDFELQRFIGAFKLLRNQGCTLRVVPGTPEENAPVFDFEKEELIRPAA